MKFQYYNKIAENTSDKYLHIDKIVEILKSDTYKLPKQQLAKIPLDDKSARGKFKRNTFPYVTFAGKFPTTRSRKNVEIGLGFVVADIDDIELSQVPTIRNELIKREDVFLLFESPSGKIKVIHKAPVVKNDDDYKVLWDFLEKDYKNKHNIEIDKSGKDISRATFLCYDPEPYLNKDAKEFVVKEQPKEKVPPHLVHLLRVPEIKKIFYGDISDFDNDRSRADMAIVNKLVFKNLSDDDINTFMNLGQTGWKEKTDHYKQRTIDKARENKLSELPAPIIETENREYPIRTLYDIKKNGIPKVEWRVDRILQKSGATIFGGKPGQFKTWAGMQLALACATGNPFMDHFEVEKCNVLYIDEENGNITTPNRLDKLVKGHNYDNEEDLNNLYTAIFNTTYIDDDVTVKLLEKIIEENDIKVIVFDSMVRCMQGSENDATDVRKIFNNLKELMIKFPDLSFVLLHHTNKSGQGSNALRGSTEFVAFPDVLFMFDSKSENVVEMKVEKIRNFDKSVFSGFKFQVESGEEYVALRHASDSIEERGKKEKLVYSIKIWIKDNNITEFKTAQVSELTSKLGYGRGTMFKALKRMREQGTIKSNRNGIYKVEVENIDV